MVDTAQRLVWSVVEGRLSHHNGSIQVFPESTRCRLVWIADILPLEIGALYRVAPDLDIGALAGIDLENPADAYTFIATVRYRKHPGK